MSRHGSTIKHTRVIGTLLDGLSDLAKSREGGTNHQCEQNLRTGTSPIFVFRLRWSMASSAKTCNKKYITSEVRSCTHCTLRLCHVAVGLWSLTIAAVVMIVRPAISTSLLRANPLKQIVVSQSMRLFSCCTRRRHEGRATRIAESEMEREQTSLFLCQVVNLSDSLRLTLSLSPFFCSNRRRAFVFVPLGTLKFESIPESRNCLLPDPIWRLESSITF